MSRSLKKCLFHKNEDFNKIQASLSFLKSVELIFLQSILVGVFGIKKTI